MNAQQLKNAILQEAIQGRLVPQDHNDEPASVLLDRIRKEKQQLVKEGKLKKKDLEVKPISEDEFPFEIPEGWIWVRLGEIASYITDGEHKTPRRITNYCGYYLLSARNVFNGYINLENVDYVDKEEYENISKHCNPHFGDVLISCSGSVGRTAVVKDNNNYVMVRSAAVISPMYTDSDYLMYTLQSTELQSQIEESSKQTAQANLFQGAIKTLKIPLPPLAEQKRIVAKIEELLPKVEKYGKAQDELNKLNEELPERLKKSILQEAIEGRLVPQDPNDEPVSALLAKIREEKKQLVKEGKLKKKDLEILTISEDEIKYALPTGWIWSKLSFITSLLDGEKRDGDYVCLDAKYLRGKSSGDFLSKGKFVKKGDNIILVDGENSGEVFTVPCDGYMGSTFKQLWVSESMYLPYVLHFIRFYKDILRNSKRGAAIPHLNKDIFYNLVIGIPPLAEQYRIVEKIEQLFKEIDKLKK